MSCDVAELSGEIIHNTYNRSTIFASGVSERPFESTGLKPVKPPALQAGLLKLRVQCGLWPMVPFVKAAPEGGTAMQITQITRRNCVFFFQTAPVI